jgi:probable phosphoglycerate mutase
VDRLRLIAVRHGQTESNATRRYVGQSDSPLTPVGREQVARLKERFASVTFDAVYSSDLGRALTTAQALTEPHGHPIVQDPRLRERDYGEFEGRIYDDVRAEHPELYAALDRFSTTTPMPGGESVDEVFARVGSFCDNLMADPPGENVVLVAHGGVVRALLGTLLDLPFRAVRWARCENTSVSVFEYEGGMWCLDRWNDTCHLFGM